MSMDAASKEDESYHYTESGLDNVFLGNGFRYNDAGGRRRVVIKDIDGLHKAIGRTLVDRKESLTGKEVRFLRHELLMSQSVLAKLLGVTEQTVHRWEKGKTDIPKAAEKLLRLMYMRRNAPDGGGPAETRSIDAILRTFADLEDDRDWGRITMRKGGKDKPWYLDREAKAA
jgi:putative zinc finger/helix-turn-helix YgiT family protein